MLTQQILLGIIGLSSGTIVAAGLFAFIVELGVISDFADRTHTADQVLLYEDAVIVGGIAGNLFFVYQMSLGGMAWILPVFGLFSGIFTGCWAMALAEVLNIFPVFARRMKLIRGVPWVILGIAVGKGLGAFLHFYQRWGL